MTATQNIPRPVNVRALDARGAATLALLDSLPAGTEVVYSEVPASQDKSVRAAQQRAASAKVISFRKSFSNRKGRGTLHTRTETRDGFVRALVYADPNALRDRAADTTTTTTYVNTPSTSATGSGINVTITVPKAEKAADVIKKLEGKRAKLTETLAGVDTKKSKPVANPDRTKVSKLTKTRAANAVNYEKWLAKAEKLVNGEFTKYKNVVSVSTLVFRGDESRAERARVGGVQSSRAQQLNRKAAERNLPVRFESHATKTGVRLDARLTD